MKYERTHFESEREEYSHLISLGGRAGDNQRVILQVAISLLLLKMDLNLVLPQECLSPIEVSCEQFFS